METRKDFFTLEDFALYEDVLDKLKRHPYNLEIDRRIANCPAYSAEELQEFEDNVDLFPANFFWSVLVE